MKLLDAHARYALRYESGEYAPFDDIEYSPMDDAIQPAMMCAAASLSGMLDECETDENLDAAVRHFLSLHEAEVISLDQWKAEIMRVIDDVCRFAESAELN